MLEAVADKLHDFNLFQLFFSQSGYRDFSVINIVGVAGRYGQVCWSVCLFRPEVLLNFLKESHSRDFFSEILFSVSQLFSDFVKEVKLT